MSPRDPPATMTWPDVNFVPARVRRGISARIDGPMSPAAGSAGAPSGMPMSMTATRPACSLPGLIHRPGLAAANVAVAVACTAAPPTSPVDASTPLGTSAAMTGASAASMAARTDAAGSRGAPVTPVPSTASTIAATPSRRSGANGSLSTGSARRFAAASPCSSSGGGTSRTRTTRPPRCSRRAATRPSPPLLPLPQTIATGPVGATSHTRPARPSPARSMSCSDGTPRSSIAQRSVARIASASNSGSAQSGNDVMRSPRRRRPCPASG